MGRNSLDLPLPYTNTHLNASNFTLQLWITILCEHCRIPDTGWPRSYRKYILQITQPSEYGYGKLQYRFAVTSGSPSRYIFCSTDSSAVEEGDQQPSSWMTEEGEEGNISGPGSKKFESDQNLVAQIYGQPKPVSPQPWNLKQLGWPYFFVFFYLNLFCYCLLIFSPKKHLFFFLLFLSLYVIQIHIFNHVYVNLNKYGHFL